MGLGQPGKERFDRDILGQRGLRAVIIFEAINDIGTSTNPEETARQLIEAYQVMIKKALPAWLEGLYGYDNSF